MRAIVTLALVGGFIWGFIFLAKISADVFTTVVSGIVGYWFAARQGEQATKAAIEAAITAPPKKDGNGHGEAAPKVP
mgnify:CR=1 FL=1